MPTTSSKRCTRSTQAPSNKSIPKQPRDGNSKGEGIAAKEKKGFEATKKQLEKVIEKQKALLQIITQDGNQDTVKSLKDMFNYYDPDEVKPRKTPPEEWPDVTLPVTPEEKPPITDQPPHTPDQPPTAPAVCYTKRQLEEIIEEKKTLLQILTQDENDETLKNLKDVKDIAVKVTNLTHERQDRSMEVEAHRNEFDANVAGTYQVMHTMYGVCATGSLPRTQFTCEPIVLPKLNPPKNDNLSKYPGGVKLPPIIVNHENFCLNGGKASETQKRDDDEEMLKEIANLRLACMTFKKSYAANLCEVVDQQPQVEIQEAANDNGVNPELTDRFGRQPAPDEETVRKQEQAKKKTENENLMGMLGTLQADIQAIKSSNTRGRRSIIERCIELKQREAAIVECSQMLCHILDAQRTVDDLLLEWQNAKLKRHIEYLRWVLIRLKYERHVQNNEIRKLDSSVRQQKYVLLECLETKRRVCDAERESSVNQMDVFDICSLLE